MNKPPCKGCELRDNPMNPAMDEPPWCAGVSKVDSKVIACGPYAQYLGSQKCLSKLAEKCGAKPCDKCGYGQSWRAAYPPEDDSPCDLAKTECTDYGVWLGQQQGYALAMKERDEHRK